MPSILERVRKKNIEDDPTLVAMCDIAKLLGTKDYSSSPEQLAISLAAFAGESPVILTENLCSKEIQRMDDVFVSGAQILAEAVACEYIIQSARLDSTMAGIKATHETLVEYAAAVSKNHIFLTKAGALNAIARSIDDYTNPEKGKPVFTENETRFAHIIKLKLHETGPTEYAKLAAAGAAVGALALVPKAIRTK